MNITEANHVSSILHRIDDQWPDATAETLTQDQQQAARAARFLADRAGKALKLTLYRTCPRLFALTEGWDYSISPWTPVHSAPWTITDKGRAAIR